jgi:hypothetical protein
MINHYQSTNEYLRFAMALPAPLNVIPNPETRGMDYGRP